MSSSDPNNFKMSPGGPSSGPSDKKVSSKTRKYIIGAVAASVVIIGAVVLGITLSNKTDNYMPTLQASAGTARMQGLDESTQSLYWGDKFDLICPGGEYIKTLYGYKYVSEIKGLAALCSGGSKVGDPTILTMVNEQRDMIHSIASNGSNTIYFYLVNIYDIFSAYQSPRGISFFELTPNDNEAVPINGLIGAYDGSVMWYTGLINDGSAIRQKIKSKNNKPIAGLAVERGTRSYKGSPCVCAFNPFDDVCQVSANVPMETMMCYSAPRSGIISVFA